QTPVSSTEIKRCQRQLYNDYIFSTESAGQLAGLYGYYSTIATAEAAYSYPLEIQKLTANDVMQLAQRYLYPHRYAITILNSIA
ncbi:MAG: insulinase family protein, partial [Moorea sp. SIO3E2]|nr:insulinase family protein [Moorena sp. SIO3E2]